MPEIRMYAIICHVGRSSHYLKYESAYCDAETKEEVEVRLAEWVRLRKVACISEYYQCECQSIIVDKLTPDIVASGATENMIKIE